MKKIALVLSLVLIVFALAACTSSKPAENEDNTKDPVVNEPAKNETETEDETEELVLVDGTYTGTAKGFKSDIEVEVVVEGEKITSVTVLSHGDSEGIAEPAIEGIPTAIVEAQSVEVDAVAGATKTSKGIMEAVKAALAGE